MLFEGVIVARVFGSLGSEKVLIQKLNERRIGSLWSLSDIENHIKNSEKELEQIRERRVNDLKNKVESYRQEHRVKLDRRNMERKARMDMLKEEHNHLKDHILQPLISTRNPVIWIRSRWTRYRERSRCKKLDTDFLGELDRPFRKVTEYILRLEHDIQNIETNFDGIIEQQMNPDVARKIVIDKALADLSGWLAGARGELKTLNELIKLPAQYVVVNDVQLRFEEPLYKDGRVQYSCQMDHVVISPAGLFNIESKNWSQISIENLDLRSPVEQIGTSGKGLYLEVNRAIRQRRIRLKKHHWGEREVRVWNILSMAGAMPNVDFQYVKMLPTKDVPSYIQSIEPRLSDSEIESIKSWILRTTSIDSGYR